MTILETANASRSRIRLWPMVAFAVIVLIIVLSIVYYRLAARALPIHPGTNTHFYGYIESGGKFGFEVGKPFSTIVQNDNKSYRVEFYGTSGCMGTYKKISNCSAGSKHASFTVNGVLYHGQIFVGVAPNGTIGSVIWNADVFPPEWAI